MMLHVSEPEQGLYKCIKNWTEDKDGETTDLCTYLTIGKYYQLSNDPQFQDKRTYQICIIDDLNEPHYMNKNMFINIQELRETKLKQLGI
jgi:hypothetical protein